MKYLVVKLIETESRMVVARCLVGEMGNYLKGEELHFCKMKSSGDWLHNVNVLNITELCA